MLLPVMAGAVDLLDNYDGSGDLTYNEDTANQWTIDAGGYYLATTDGVSTPEHSYASYDLSASIPTWSLGAGNDNEWIGWINILRNPSGWGSSNYGAGYVLAANNSVLNGSTTEGYALVLRGSNDELALIKFSTGIAGSSVDIPTGSTIILNTGYIYDIGHGGRERLCEI